jgi:hypothetical protein
VSPYRQVLPSDRRRLSRLQDGEILYLLGTAGDVMPVRAIEEALRRGPGLGRSASALLLEPPSEPGWDPLWLLVYLGRFADPRHGPAIARFLTQAPQEDHYVFAAGVEALAASGEEAMEVAQTLLASPEEDARLAGCAVLGHVATPAARQILERTLETDPGLADVVAPALGWCGSPESLQVLGAALPRVEVEHRVEVETAIRQLHHRIRPFGPRWRDWRLRYRCDRFWPVFDPGWAGVARLYRKDPGMAGTRPELPLRPLEAVVAEAEAEGLTGPEELACYLCGAPAELRQGLESCADHVEEVRQRQLELMDELVEEVEAIHGETVEAEEPLGELEELADLFTLLVYAESQWRDLAEEQDLIGGAARPDEIRALEWDVHLAHVAVDTLRGLISEGVETLEGAWSRLVPGAPIRASGSMVEGGAMVLARAHFRVSDPEVARRALDRSVRLRSDARKAGVWSWRDPSGTGDLGQVELAGSTLVLECLTEERIARGRAFLERVMGAPLEHRATTVQGTMDPFLEMGWGNPREGGGEAPEWH